MLRYRWMIWHYIGTFGNVDTLLDDLTLHWYLQECLHSDILFYYLHCTFAGICHIIPSGLPVLCYILPYLSVTANVVQLHQVSKLYTEPAMLRFRQVAAYQLFCNLLWPLHSICLIHTQPESLSNFLFADVVVDDCNNHSSSAWYRVSSLQLGYNCNILARCLNTIQLH
jgi:hypothetical protein